MGFYEVYSKYKNFDFKGFLQRVNRQEILKILQKDKINRNDFLKLLSPVAANFLEEMAQKAHKLSLKHFGRAILLYTPIYLSNYCVNRCAYCSYNVKNNITRKKLTFSEIEKEAQNISSTGLRHILVLTGESRKETPLEYIIEAIKILKRYFSSISIEIYPLTEVEYSQVIEAGVDGLTIYQEVYNEQVYDEVHISGPKKDYEFRLDAPERAARAKIRSVNIGALFGLYQWDEEAFFAGLHAEYLQNKYPDVEISVSLPRIRPHVGSFKEIYTVRNKDLVQIMLALKLFLPFVGITISTREKQEFRDNLIPLGITKMSAGVSTEVGGHSLTSKGDRQFEISDKRSVEQVKQAILLKGYQPIFKDWMKF